MTTELPGGRRPRLLYLEDDNDVRELLSDWLRESGYDVTPLATAELALKALRGPIPFDLLLSDFRLPKHNADWLLAEARGEQLLKQTAVIILSSENNPPGIGDAMYLQKPVDVGLLLTHINRALDPPVPPEPAAPLIVLRLYVSSSVESLKAERHVRKVLDAVDPKSERRYHDFVRLDVINVAGATGPMLDAIEEDRVIVTPTLVRRTPGPCASFLGDVSRNRVVEEMLRDAIELTHTAPADGARR